MTKTKVGIFITFVLEYLSVLNNDIYNLFYTDGVESW